MQRFEVEPDAPSELVVWPRAIPSDFQFSQASLQDYVDCRRRFYLRYLLELDWPAIEAEPAEAYEFQLRQADAFHHLVHQHQSGVPLELLSRQVEADNPSDAGEQDEEQGPAPLAQWWRNYLQHPPPALPPVRYSEITLSAPLRSYRLAAQYDLIAVESSQEKAPDRPFRAVIVEWKTWKKRPSQAWLTARMQTRVYRYVLVRAGAELYTGHATGSLSLPRVPGAGSADRASDRGVEPSQVEMVYWFANHPKEPERLPYDVELYQADEAFLASMIVEIEQATQADSADSGFPKTDDITRCHFCVYRSFCNRGIEAGDLTDGERFGLGDLGPDGEPALDLDFEQIAEIAY